MQAQADRIAEADFKRAEALNADEIIAQKDHLRAKAEFEKAAANMRAAGDRLRMLGGSPAPATTAVSTFAVTAPFAGTVIEKKAILGRTGQPDKPLFTVADLPRCGSRPTCRKARWPRCASAPTPR